MKTLILVSFLFFISPAFSIGYVIGNGGDGLLKDGKLYLYDLVEGGVETSPFLGTHTHSSIRKLISSMKFPAELPFSKDLLARKLSDLEQISPHLGIFVFESINSYNWMPVDTPLSPIEDPENIITHSPQQRVQIANRSEASIRIHKDSWQALDEANRVALIIHEGIYSLLKPICGKEETCYQPARVARTITALAFNEEHFRINPGELRPYIVPHLDIPSLPSSTFTSPQNWLLLWSTNSPNSDSYALSLEIPLKSDLWYNFLNEACRSYFVSYILDKKTFFYITSQISLKPYRTKFIRYRTKIYAKDKSKMGDQLRFSVYPREDGKTEDSIQFKFSEENALSCVDELLKHYEMALN